MLHTRFTALIVVTVFLAACDSGGSSTPALADSGSTGAAPAPVADNRSAKPEADKKMVNAVKSRKSVLVVTKDNFVPLALMAGGRIDYNAEAAQKFANRLPVMLGMLEERFATDTRGSGVETEALDAVWEDMDAFKGKISNALDAANKLAAVAGDKAQYKEATMALRDACGSCHDDFRVDTD